MDINRKEINNTEEYLIIKGARQNNLKNIDLQIPHNKLTVITGISGSGKSSLAFDTIYAEGQWRFIECMSSYARVFIEKLPRPDVDLIDNLRPTIALEQRNPVKGSRATVGTHTEIYDYLRILFSKIAKPFCPKCNKEIRAWNATQAGEKIFKDYKGKRAFIMFETNESPKKLIQLGFSKAFFIENEQPTVRELAELENSNKKYYIIADRLRISDKSRLMDSLETAFKMGRVKVYIDLRTSSEDTQSTIHHSPFTIVDFPTEPHCPDCGMTASEASPMLFSFNHPQGACPECKGFGYILTYDEKLIIPSPSLSLRYGAIDIFERPTLRWWKQQLIKGAKLSGINVDIPYEKLPDEHKKLIFNGNQYFYGINDFFEELERKKYKVHVRVFLSKIRKPQLCPVCRGKRLKESALAFKIDNKDIGDLNFMSVKQLKEWINSLSLSSEESKISEEPLKQILMKLEFLERVGLSYLTLDRQIKTLSGGEYQRLNISNQLANRLTSTLYVLDEPTVGLHPRDTDRIIRILKELTEYGNTVLVVEHDKDVISKADWIVELGPGGGRVGGKVVFSGPKKDFLKLDSPTANFLKQKSLLADEDFSKKAKTEQVKFKNFITLGGARGHNLKNITVNIPLNALTVVTGVSGSGKSTLIIDTLYQALIKELGIGNGEPLEYDFISGMQHLKTVKLIDQSPIGKTPKSIPITYLGIYDKIREIFASHRDSKLRGFTAGHFSLNSALGQCPNCKGDGFVKIEMYFFEDMFLPCDECEGKRFKKEVLEVKYKEKNIYEVLSMSFDEAYEFFEDESLKGKIAIVRELGLGYLLLGQPATTLSGGEAQRLKICAEILNSLASKSRSSLKGFVYIMDEPTVGLHHEDVKKFLSVVRKLIDRSATVVIIEHNLDVIANADWIIDLGPEGGDDGGYLMHEGSIHDFLNVSNSQTVYFLKREIRRF